MQDIVNYTSEANSVWAVLVGGPASIPKALRTQTVKPIEQKIKIPHYGGYEHFERTVGLDEITSSEKVVFRWTMRTELAE